MPQIDVTSPAVTGLNALSDVAGGFMRGHALAGQIEDRRQSRQEDVEYRDLLHKTKIKEMEALARERVKADERLNRGLDLEERRTKVSEDLTADGIETRKRGREDLTLGADFVGKMTERALGVTNVEKFEEELAAQRAAGTRFAAGLSSREARELVMGGIDDDERAERAALARRAAKLAWESAATNPAFSEGGMSDELKALSLENIEALETGAETPAKSMSDLEEIRKLARKELKQAKDFEWGLGWAAQQIDEGGGDIEGMHDALSDFETLGPTQASISQLKRDVLRAKHNIDVDEVKLGKVSVPRGIKVGSPEWTEIAEAAADQEVGENLSKDPWLRAHVKDMPMSEYLNIREENRRSTLRKYGAQSGMTRPQMEARGWIMKKDAKAAGDQARDAIRTKLREAGIDPNLRIDALKQSGRADVNRRQSTPALDPKSGLGLKPMPEDTQEVPREPVQPGRQRISSKGVNDGDEYDEDDLETIYGDG